MRRNHVPSPLRTSLLRSSAKLDVETALTPALNAISLSLLTDSELDLQVFCNSAASTDYSSPCGGTFPLHYFPTPPSSQSTSVTCSSTFSDAYWAYMQSYDVDHLSCPGLLHDQSFPRRGSDQSDSVSSCVDSLLEESDVGSVPTTPASDTSFGLEQCEDCDEIDQCNQVDVQAGDEVNVTCSALEKLAFNPHLRCCLDDDVPSPIDPIFRHILPPPPVETYESVDQDEEREAILTNDLFVDGESLYPSLDSIYAITSSFQWPQDSVSPALKAKMGTFPEQGCM